MKPPSGRQLQLSHGEQRVVVVEAGAGLRAYAVGDRQVLDGYPLDAMCDGSRGQLLLPWPNRIRDGHYRFGGQDLQLPLSEPRRCNAIHGLLRWLRWEVVEEQADHVALRHRLVPQPGYPFALALRVDYQLDASGLTVRTAARNEGDGPCPYGAGAHPYVRVGAGSVDDAILELPSAVVLEADGQGIPTGERHRVDGGPLDFTTPRRLGATVLDTAYAELRRDPAGIARASLATPGGDERVTVWMDSAHANLMVYTGDTLEAPAARRRGVALEPMTCAPDAFNSGDGLTVLEPGATHAGTWGITPY